MIQHSESVGTIMAALHGVQQDVDHVSKDAQNPHYGNTYTTLNAFLRALRGSLAERGVIMTQAPGMDGEHVVVETMLYHTESGEWIRNQASSPMQKDDPQGVGSAITYLRRYSLAALFAVPQEDDDGNAASARRTGQGNGQQRGRSGSTKGAEAAYHCPECGGPMWDNRADKEAGERSEKFPDFKCKDCDHPIWGSHPDDEKVDTETGEITEPMEDPRTRYNDLFADHFSDSQPERIRNKKAWRVAHPDLPDQPDQWTDEHYALSVRQIEKALDNGDDPFEKARNAYSKIQAESLGAKGEDEEEEEEDGEPVPAGAEGEQGDMPF